MEVRQFLRFLAPLAAEGLKSGVTSGGFSILLAQGRC